MTEFKIVKRPEVSGGRRRKRRSWGELIRNLVGVTKSKALFVPLEEVSDADMKYLSIALGRRGKGERLRTMRTVHDGVEGRLLWTEIVHADDARA